MAPTTNIIERVFNDTPILQRSDGRWSATSMCKAAGKDWYDYLRNASTQEFLAELSAETGIPVSAGQKRSPGIPGDLLIESITTGPNNLRGTWVHKRVAQDLARWLSAKFAVRVNGWVDELLETGRVELRPAVPAGPTLGPYINRVMQSFAIQSAVPTGYWCVFGEAADLLIFAEQIFIPAGLEMQAYDLLDGSVGTHWKNFRSGKPWAGERIYYPHRFPQGDPRGTRPALAYLLAELPYFRGWLREVYVPSLMPCYLSNKYGVNRLRLAAPVLRRLGLNMPAALMAN